MYVWQSGHPGWEDVGVRLTTDVAPYVCCVLCAVCCVLRAVRRALPVPLCTCASVQKHPPPFPPPRMCHSYEHAKIRLLNAGHSVLSLPAYASGLQLVSEAATQTLPPCPPPPPPSH